MTYPTQIEDANYLKKVREQYENYPYPPIDPNIEFKTLRIPILESLDNLNHHGFGGKRNFKKEFRSLIAGGGTGDATIALAEQLRDTDNEVIYIDMSEASMKLAQQRAKNRGLTNIRWIRDSLLNIPKMNLGKFDYINCSGVLHHLADPDEGLNILSGALDERGVIGIMIYAQYGRMAVYMMQEALRMINRSEPNLQRQVDNAKKILSDLPLTNWLFNSSQMVISEMQTGGDIGIYDLLLHSQDRAYTVPQLYDYTSKAGLNILRMFSDYAQISHRVYDPTFYLQEERLVSKVRTMPLHKQRTLAELLYSKMEKHTFYTAKHASLPASIEDTDMVPFVGLHISNVTEIFAQTIQQSSAMVELQGPSQDIRVIFPKGPQLEALWRQVDGKKTLREIYRSVMDKSKDKAVNFQTLAAQFQPFYKALNDAGWLYLRHKSVPPFADYIQMQSRVIGGVR